MIELSVDIKQFCVENNMIKECSDMLKKVFAEEAFQRDTKGAEWLINYFKINMGKT